MKIDRNLYSGLLIKLNTMNINSLSLFPDIFGLAQYSKEVIHRYYDSNKPKNLFEND
jgi:hypothetical protein